MRDNARLDNNSTREPTVRDRSGGPDPFDPTLDAIRTVVDQEPPQPKRAAFPPLSAPAGSDASQQGAPGQASQHSHLLKSAARWLFGLAHSFLKRPDAPRVLAILFLLALTILRPGFVLFMFLMAVISGLVLYLSFGPDRVESFVVARYRRLRERDSTAAEKLRQRAAKTSKILSGIVDKLPESWIAGLHLPDFEETPELPDKMRADPFDRLAGQ